MELNRIMPVVTTQAALLDELLALLERETAELSSVNIPAMTQTNQEKEEMLTRIAEHAPVMQQAVSDMAMGIGLPSASPLGVIAEHLAKRGETELLRERNRLEKTTARIQQVAALNHGIAERFAATISTSLNLVTRIINQSNTYGASGGYQKGQTGAVMINREA